MKKQPKQMGAGPTYKAKMQAESGLKGGGKVKDCMAEGGMVVRGLGAANRAKKTFKEC